MTPLTQQLEDKKKGCGCEFIDGKNIYNCGERWYTHPIKGDVYDCLPNYCPKCQEIIAILEQAIAEMKSKENEFRELLNEEIGKSYQQGYEDCEKIAIAEMQKRDKDEIELLKTIEKWICKVTPEMQLDNEILREVCPNIFYNCENRIEQLNQPKTER